MNYRYLFFIIFSLISSLSTFAQKTENDSIDNDSTDIEKKSYLTASITYASNSVSYGRVQANTINPTIGASIGYDFKSGIYFNAETGIMPTQASSTVTTQPNIFGGLSLQGGYGFSIVEDVLSADVNYTHSFFQNTSKITSEIQGTAAASISADLSWIGADLGSNFSYGNANTDILFNFSINKNINLFPIGKDTLSITPTLTTYAGTQNLIGLHLRNIPKRITNPKLKTAIEAENAKLIADAKLFKFIDLDVEIPVSYTISLFTFEISPTFSFPSNLIEPVKSNYFAKNPFFINFSVSIKV